MEAEMGKRISRLRVSGDELAISVDLNLRPGETVSLKRRESICFVAPTFPRRPGGGERTIYEHASGLARRGYHVSVLHSLNRRAAYHRWMLDVAQDKLRDLRVGSLARRVSWLAIDPRVQMLEVDRLDKSTKLPPADLLIGTFWRTTDFLASRLGESRVMQLIQSYENWAGPEEAVVATWQLPIHSAVVSHYLWNKGLELGVPAHRLHIVPNGLDHSTYRDDVARPRVPMVAFQASTNPVKGLADALQVARRIHDQRPDVTITAFGVGPRMRQLPRYVSYVRGLAGQALVERVYRRTAVMLCTSHSEGWGFPSMEAMACGAALVSTRNGGVEDFATDGASALLCDVADIDALANAALALLGDEPERRRVAKEGMQSAARFRWELSTDAMERVVEVALK
jgi:L-malate glycosyltransferase